MEEEMSLFSSKPRSFRMDGKSPQAADLKSSVLRELPAYLDNYTDEDLADYIVVLVCNGKNQNQARDCLQDFLGDASGKFIMWLWNHLSEEMDIRKLSSRSLAPKTAPDAASDDVVDKKYKVTRETDYQTRSTLPKDENYRTSNCPSNSKLSNDACVSEDSQGLGFKSMLTEVNNERSWKKTCNTPRPPVAADDIRDQAMLLGCSGVTSCSKFPAGCDEGLQVEERYHKMAKTRTNGGPHLRLSPKREIISSSLKSIVTGDPHYEPPSTVNATGKKPSVEPVDSVPCQTNQPRGSVWDRLGKPCGNNDATTDDNVLQRASDILKRKRVGHPYDRLEERRLKYAEPGARQKIRVAGEATMGNRQADEFHLAGYDTCTVDSVNDTVSLKRKRLLDETSHKTHYNRSSSNNGDNNLKCKETPNKLQIPVSGRSVSAENLENSSPGFESYLKKPAIVAPNLNSGRKMEASPFKVKTLAPYSSSTATKHVPVSSISGKMNERPVKNEIPNLNYQLQQVEKEVSELQSKQAEMSGDAKAMTSIGAQNPIKESIETRTIFVTNVHFAASKEALLLHFSKCGPVHNVILLSDAYTGQPKGHAYIVFTSKESAEKAISLTGTSFMSRTLKVMWKADMPKGILEPSHPPAKPLQSRYPQPHWATPFQKPYSSSHLQWRRDQQASGETSVAAQSSKTE